MNKVKNFFKNNWMYIGAGIVIGVVAFVLTLMGNPANMGFCIACFLRDTAGALKLHSAAVVQYARPEIIGIVPHLPFLFSEKTSSLPAARLRSPDFCWA